MRRLVVALAATAAALALSAPASAWPPFCKPAIVYEITGICV